MINQQQFIKILRQKKGIDKSLLVKKFIKKIEYCRDGIAITAYSRNNHGQETAINDAIGWVRAATGKIENHEFSKQIYTGISREIVMKVVIGCPLLTHFKPVKLFYLTPYTAAKEKI